MKNRGVVAGVDEDDDEDDEDDDEDEDDDIAIVVNQDSKTTLRFTGG